jgi:hypothetical protein
MLRGWHRNGSPTLAVAEEKFGSSIMQVSSVPAGKTTSFAMALPVKPSASATHRNKTLAFIVELLLEWKNGTALCPL